MSKLFIVVLVLLYSIILHPSETTQDSIHKLSNIEIQNNGNIDREFSQKVINKIINFMKMFFNSIWFRIFLPFFILIIGFVSQKLIGRDTIRFADVADRANTIRDIFIDCSIKINNLNPHENIKAGNIVIDNIINTDILIKKVLPYVGFFKKRQIKKHYNKYKKPYKNSPTANVMLEGLNDLYGDKDRKPSKYFNPKIPNARKIAIIHLKKLINDFERV